MDVFFADDSSQKGIREGMGTIVSSGGVFVEESALRPFSKKIDDITTAFKIPPDEELKWSPKKGSWLHSNLHGENRTECYRQILRAAYEFNVRAIVVCWDTGKTTLKNEKAFAKCIEYMFERVTVHLDKRNAYAIMVADRPGGGKDQEEYFLSEFLNHFQNGTEHVIPDRILLNVLTTPSHLVRHLQLADLVTGITTAMVCGQTKYAGPLFPDIKPLLIRNTVNGIAATGLKIVPDENVNLYYWILKENFLHKNGGAISYRLPASNYPYSEDEKSL